MKVKMKTIKAGPKGSARPGDTIIVEDHEGRALVDGGFAALVEGSLDEKKSTGDEPGKDEQAPERPRKRTSKKSR